jgi:uncharacterized membrane protein YkvA (DUF1232 family)
MATTSSTSPNGKDIAASAIFKKFLAAAEGYIKQPSRLKKLLVDSFNKAREKKEIGAIAHEVWDTLQSLFRLIKLSASGEYTGLPATTTVAAVAVLIYFISPIDLIPDFIPVVGLLDDMALIAWFSTSIKHELDKFHEWEATKGSAVVMDSEPWETRSGSTTNQSAKSAGTTALPLAPAGAGQSATDAGLGSPSSTTTSSVHSQGPDIGSDSRRTGDVAANTTEGSRHDNDGREATGGNVR